jgi:hypothetical protein
MTYHALYPDPWIASCLPYYSFIIPFLATALFSLWCALFFMLLCRFLVLFMDVLLFFSSPSLFLFGHPLSLRYGSAFRLPLITFLFNAALPRLLLYI